MQAIQWGEIRTMIEKIDDPDVLDIVLKHRNKAGRRMEDTAVSVRRMYTF